MQASRLTVMAEWLISGQNALALDFHHAGTAIAVGPIARLGRVAKMRDFHPDPLGDLPDGLVRCRRNIFAIERKFDVVRHDPVPVFFTDNLGFAVCPVNWTLYWKCGVFGGWASVAGRMTNSLLVARAAMTILIE